MKKVLFYLIAIAILIPAGIIIYKFFIEPEQHYRSIYHVPGNAIMIIEVENPVLAWKEIVHSDAWEKLRHNDYLLKLDSTITRIDSVINSKKILFRMAGSRKIILSVHETTPARYDNLYIIDLKKASKFKNSSDYLSKILNDNYSVTERVYKNRKIYEVYAKKINEIFYFTVVHDQLIFSTVPVLIESSVDQINKLTLGRDLEFIDVYKRTSGKGLFSLYINHKYFSKYLNRQLGKSNPFVNIIKQTFDYSGFTFTIDDAGNIALSGFTNINDSARSVLVPVILSGETKHDIARIVPRETASMVSIGFKNIEGMIKEIRDKQYENFPESYNKTLSRLEKKFRISFTKNFLSWIDNEIALVQTQPSNLGSNDEFAVVFKAKNNKDAKQNLDLITRQIKRNMPAKFREVNYRGYEINYLSVPGFLKIIFGRMLEKLEKPYYTIIDNYVVFSNHPQTLKNFIDSYISKNALGSSIDYYNYIKTFSGKSSIMLYLQTPVLFSNLQSHLSNSVWNKLKSNKDYITSFPNIGFQLKNEDNLIKIDLSTEYKHEIPEFKPANYNIDAFEFSEGTQKQLLTDTSGNDPSVGFSESSIIIHDLDANKHEEFFADGSLKLSVGLRRGEKHGRFYEYYPNGETKIKGRFRNNTKTGTWKYFDEQGELVREEEF